MRLFTKKFFDLTPHDQIYTLEASLTECDEEIARGLHDDPASRRRAQARRRRIEQKAIEFGIWEQERSQAGTLDDLLQQDWAGNCYEAAVKWTWAASERDWTVVHGTVRSVTKRIDHAWCERGQTVIDRTMPVGMREVEREKYYRILVPEISKKYTGEQVSVLLAQNGHFGPWDDPTPDE